MNVYYRRDLARVLAKRVGISIREADLFLKEYICGIHSYIFSGIGVEVLGIVELRCGNKLVRKSSILEKMRCGSIESNGMLIEELRDIILGILEDGDDVVLNELFHISSKEGNIYLRKSTVFYPNVRCGVVGGFRKYWKNRLDTKNTMTMVDEEESIDLLNSIGVVAY